MSITRYEMTIIEDQQYPFEFVVEAQECAVGDWVRFIDHEATVAAAVQAERERCRREEVSPLMDELRCAKKAIDLNDLACRQRQEEQEDIETVLAAVEQVMKENP